MNRIGQLEKLPIRTKKSSAENYSTLKDITGQSLCPCLLQKSLREKSGETEIMPLNAEKAMTESDTIA